MRPWLPLLTLLASPAAVPVESGARFASPEGGHGRAHDPQCPDAGCRVAFAAASHAAVEDCRPAVGLLRIELTHEHDGLHATPEPSRVEHTASHGCVRLTNWDVLRVAAHAKKGTRVVFQE
jgi:L,D-transpeptidase catalytic domain